MTFTFFLFLYLSIFNLRIIGGLVAKSCLTFCDSMDYSPPSSFLRGISQAKILEWVATSFSRRSRGIEPGSLAFQAESLLTEPPGKPPGG